MRGFLIAAIIPGISGCLDPASQDGANATRAAFGISLLDDPPVTASTFDSWFFMAGGASPSGWVGVAFVEVPPEARIGSPVPGVSFAAVETLILCRRESCAAVDAWGLIHLARPSQDLSLEAPWALYGGIIEASSSNASIEDPDGQPPRRPNLAPRLFHVPLPDEPRIPFIFLARGTQDDEVGLLFRFADPDQAEPSSAKEMLAAASAGAYSIPTSNAASSFTYADWTEGVRSRDLQAARTEGLDSFNLSFQSELQSESGWGAAFISASAGAKLLQWSFSGEMHGTSVAKRGTHSAALGVVRGFDAPSFSRAAEGSGASNLRLELSVSPPMGDLTVRYRHLDFGTNISEALGYTPVIPPP